VATAKVIHETLRTRFADRTRILITHELYLSQGADKIVVVELGRVVQQGTHDELLKQPGLYREMWALHHPEGTE